MVIGRNTGMACLLATIALGASAPAFADTLEDALIQAYRNNPSLLAERARLRATDEGVAQAISNWRPTVTVSGDVGKQRVDSESVTSSGVSNRTPYGGSLQVSQNIYRGGRTTAATRRAEKLVQSDRARLSGAEQAVLLSAATAYVDVVRDQGVIALNINNEKVLSRQLEATRDRFRVGEVTRTDVAQAESRLARAKADRIRAEGDLVSSRAVYQNVTGAAPGKLEPAGPLGGLPGDEADAVALARTKAFAVIQADNTERAALDQVREVTGELLPLVTVTGSLSENHNNTSSDNQSETAAITARVSIPLYQSGSVSSRVRAAKQIVVQRRNERNQAVRDAVEAATRAWEALQTAQAQIVSFTAEARASGIALEGVEQEARVGSRTVLDVLDAEQELLNARVSLTRAKRDEVVATYQLRAAVGRLTAESLGLEVDYYDPGRHYDGVRNKWFGTRIDGEN